MPPRIRAWIWTGSPECGCRGLCSKPTSQSGSGVECLAGLTSAANALSVISTRHPNQRQTRVIPCFGIVCSFLQLLYRLRVLYPEAAITQRVVICGATVARASGLRVLAASRSQYIFKANSYGSDT